ncbi:MAG: phenylalanine--tRNA ligase subunit alpha [Gammaproteobacteria bacterium]|nr:phenylalanine--tRNA ligase subunit alpha [Gammaproteobacteria bacterium]
MQACQLQFLEESQVSSSEEARQALQKKYLKQILKELYADLKNVIDPAEKKTAGGLINQFRQELELAFSSDTAVSKVRQSEVFCDPTAIKMQFVRGHIHPLIHFTQKMEEVFINMGFSIVYGPEIEKEENNFEKLNIPLHHPARDMQDTFYIKGSDKLLRSHTSSVQIRTMENAKPPLKIISVGNVYRVDDIDAQHTPMFYQTEGLVVDKGIRFSDLKGVLIQFIKTVFGENIQVRFRPSYYPYTEPSAAVDMSCPICATQGCRTCKQAGWITILGAGMVHPNVFLSVGYDPKEVSGFAFGLGVNRLAMIYYQMAEIRGFYENDISLWASV